MKRESNPSPNKKWAKPKLIILTRGKPEEGVLGGCKAGGGIDTGPVSQFWGCSLGGARLVGPCVLCSAYDGS